MATKHPEGTDFQFQREHESVTAATRDVAAAVQLQHTACDLSVTVYCGMNENILIFRNQKKHDMIIIRHDFTGDKYRTKRYVYYDWIDKRKI